MHAAYTSMQNKTFSALHVQSCKGCKTKICSALRAPCSLAHKNEICSVLRALCMQNRVKTEFSDAPNYRHNCSAEPKTLRRPQPPCTAAAAVAITAAASANLNSRSAAIIASRSHEISMPARQSQQLTLIRNLLNPTNLWRHLCTMLLDSATWATQYLREG